MTFYSESMYAQGKVWELSMVKKNIYALHTEQYLPTHTTISDKQNNPTGK